MNVGDICSHRRLSVSTSATLSEVAQLMRHERIGAVVITHGSGADKRVAGIVTDRDIIKAQLESGADLGRIAAGDVMTRNPLVFAAADSIEAALQHLRARGVRRAPVVDAEGSLIGLVSSDDLLAHLAQNLIGLAGIVAQQSAGS